MEDNNPNKSRRKLPKSNAAGNGAINAGKSLPESWRRLFAINYRGRPLAPFKGISAFRTRLMSANTLYKRLDVPPLMIDSKSPCLNTAIVRPIPVRIYDA